MATVVQIVAKDINRKQQDDFAILPVCHFPNLPFSTITTKLVNKQIVEIAK